MSITILADSHLDHGLTGPQIAYLVLTFLERDGFFIETIELPPELGTLPCALRGPAVGDPPVGSDAPVFFQKRGGRAHASRMVAWESKRTRQLTVIAGPHGDFRC